MLTVKRQENSGFLLVKPAINCEDPSLGKKQAYIKIKERITISMCGSMRKIKTISHKNRQTIVKKYTDINFPGAFGGVQRFRRALKENLDISIGYTALKHLLSTLPIYSMHSQSKSRFPRRKLYVVGAGCNKLRSSLTLWSGTRKGRKTP